MAETYPYEPDFAVHPGETLHEYIEYSPMGYLEFAEKLGISLEELNNILAGKASITKDFAERLANITDVSYQFWLNLQKRYDEFQSKQQEQAKQNNGDIIGETSLHVTLIAHTQTEKPSTKNAGAAVSTIAAKQCYNSDYDLEHPKADKKFLSNIADSGHVSILEHGSASFLITGVSRALSHQLVRHRLASYTQQSQRYTDMNGFKFVIPESIEKSKIARPIFIECMQYLNKKYNLLENILANEHCKNPKEDARSILPNACATQLVMTMNYREFGDFLGKRMCSRAQTEIRRLATSIFVELSKIEPILFGPLGIYKGPKCANDGFCRERKSCGMMPKLSDILNGVRNNEKD